VRLNGDSGGAGQFALRVCVVCGATLDGRRVDALVCGPACRRERSRILAILSGQPAKPYATLAQYANRRQRRAKAGETG
jgi:hypothetical protein